MTSFFMQANSHFDQLYQNKEQNVYVSEPGA